MATYLTWLHLSDLHACRPRTGWDAARVQEKLIEDLRRLRENQGLSPDLLFFTGDLAFGQIGSEREQTLEGQLSVAEAFLDEVRKALDPAFPWENVFLVPGNHDINRDEVDPAHTGWLDGLKSLDEVIDLIQKGKVGWRNVMARLADYRKFLELRPHLGHLSADPERLIWATRRRLAGLTVGIAGFNSAWSCCRNGEKGKLWMAGKWQQGELQGKLAGTEFNLALMHHPPDWLVEQESPRFGRRLRQDFRFLLHGHEHHQWVEASDGWTVLAAGACYDRSDKENGYSVVRLDVETGLGEVWLRRYEADGGGWIPRVVHGKTDERGVWPLELPWLAKLAPETASPPAVSPAAGAAAEPAVASPAWEASAELTRYLWRLRAAHRDLPVAGFETRVRIPIRLEEVYVPLRARLYRRALSGEIEEFGSFREMREAVPEEREVAFDEALALARGNDLAGAVVLGDPGSGKTTLLKHFALAVSHPERGAATLGLPAGTIPVFIALRRLGWPTAGLEPAVAEAVAAVDPSLDAPTFARALLARDGLLILVDGLDEVADAAEREAVSRWLEAAVPQLPGSTFVITSRYAGYKGDARLDGRFLELHVRDLAEAEARRFIGSWYRAVESQVDLGLDPEVAVQVAGEAAADLEERIFEAEDERVKGLRRLAKNPLMLQILCLVHRDRKTLPDKRVELYRECVLVLLELWRRAKGIEIDFTAREALKLLQPLAWWLHANDLKEAQLEDILPRLAEPLRELGKSEAEGRALLEKIRDQSGVLVSLGQGAYGFLHLSLQEYLAARHVQDRLVKERALLSELASHFGETWWREVLLLAVGLDNPSLFEPLMEELLGQEQLHKDAALADDCLRDALAKTPAPVVRALEGGLGKWEERYAALRLLDRLPGWEAVEVADGRRGRQVVEALVGEAHEPEPQVRGLASELLGGRVAVAPEVRVEGPRAGEERIHPVDGSVLVYVPGGEYVLGAEDISEREKPVHRVRLSAFWIGKYPVTNEQYARFLEVSSKAEKPKYWDDDRFNQPRQPVVGVSWEEARAYCRWVELALPSEAQWEAAARGFDRRRYPWGNQEPSPERANFGLREGKTTPVGAYPAGAGPFGTLDQAGNVWEWCADGWDETAYHGRDGKLDPVEPPPKGENASAALRGGSWAHSAQILAAAIRYRYWLGLRNQNFGFRCVLSSVSEHD